MILPTGETLGEIFAANAHRSYFMLFAYFYLHPVIDKTSTWKLFTLTLMEKSKAEESAWVKKTKKPRPKKEIAPFCQKNHVESDKALGFAKRLRQSRHLLKIWSRRESLEQVP